MSIFLFLTRNVTPCLVCELHSNNLQNRSQFKPFGGMKRKDRMMRLAVSILGVLAVTLAAAAASAAAEKALPPKPGHAAAVSSANAGDEKAIRQVVDAFANAYNAHDAKAIAALFIKDGTLIDDTNHVTKGRKAIEKVFADIFEEYPKSRIENAIESIHFEDAAKAIEKGKTTITHDKDVPVEKNRYRVVHVKQNGKWLIASSVDLPEGAGAGEDELKQLAGFIGEWVDESDDALVLTNYHWADNARFILGTFTIQMEGQPAMIGTHRIGWNPQKKAFHSWVFDSEGGFAEGDWTRDGERWIVKLMGVTGDGKSSATTQTYALIGKHRMMMQSVDSILGKEKLPDGEKFLVVRRPPAPK